MRDVISAVVGLLIALAGFGWVAFGVLSAPTPEQSGRNLTAAIVGLVGVIVIGRMFRRTV